MNISGKNIKIDNSNFDGNDGGYAVIYNGTHSGDISVRESEIIINCYFRGNSSSALQCGDNLSVYNCVVANNYHGIDVRDGDCIVKMYNCTIVSNSDYGLSLGAWNSRLRTHLELYNCIVWNNIIQEEQNYKIKFFNTEINEINTNSASFKKPILEREWKYDSSISNMVPPTGWKTADWSLSAGSIYINKGLNLYYPIADYPNDISGNSRIANGIIDLGAYEY